MTSRVNVFALIVLCLFIGCPGCGGITETQKLDTPSDVDWAALERQGDELAEQMNSRERER